MLCVDGPAAPYSFSARIKTGWLLGVEESVAAPEICLPRSTAAPIVRCIATLSSGQSISFQPDQRPRPVHNSWRPGHPCRYRISGAVRPVHGQSGQWRSCSRVLLVHTASCQLVVGSQGGGSEARARPRRLGWLRAASLFFSCACALMRAQNFV